MTIFNVFPVLMWSNPPVTAEAAAARVAEASGTVMDAPMTRLVGAVFLNYDQFRRALHECKWSAKESFLMKSGPLQTMKISVENLNNGTVYQMIATEYPQYLLVHNVRLISAPNEKPEDVESFKKTLLEDGLQ